MDLRLGPPSRARILPRGEEGIRAALGNAKARAINQMIGQMKDQAKDHGPKAEAAAVRLVECTRPLWSWFSLEWRRFGTVAAVLLAAVVLLHAMFGANGLVVYRQKHAELQALQSEVDRLQKENNQYVGEIKALKSDPAAVEKEAREQLHYTKRGEFVYVGPETPQKPPSGRAKNE